MSKTTNKVYTSPLLVNEQIYFCGVPLRLDSYSGCGHRCAYCFARAAELTVGKRGARDHAIFTADASVVKRLLVKALDWNSKSLDINIEWLRRGVPIHWGGMSDPFQPAEKKHGTSHSIMEYLNWYNYPTVISTKSTMLTEPDYLGLLKEGKYAVQISLVGDNDELLRRIEPGAPLASERLRAMFELSHAGIWVAARVQPLVPGSPFEKNLPEFIQRLARLGVKHVVIEGYKVQVRDTEGAKAIWNACPEAMKEYEWLDTAKASFENLLPAWRKWKYIKPAMEAIHANGMTYGAADNDFRDFGDGLCCCGVDSIPGFENIWTYQTAKAGQIAREKGYVTLDDMQGEWTGQRRFGPNSFVLRALSDVNKSQVTPKQCVDYWWNAGGSSSPEEMVSMVRGQHDGQLAYIYRDPVPVLEAQAHKQLAMF